MSDEKQTCCQPEESCKDDINDVMSLEDKKKMELDLYLSTCQAADVIPDDFVVKAVKEYLPRSYDGHTHHHAKRELEMGEWLKKGEDTLYNGMIGEAVLELISVFAGQGHSGMSAGVVTSLFTKLSKHEPLGPLTGEDNEWVSDVDKYSKEFAEENGYGYQNKRESAVFKNSKDGTAYYLYAILFREEDGSTFTGNSIEMPDSSMLTSRQYIKGFPFTPKTFYIDVVSKRYKDRDEKLEDINGDWWKHWIKDESQLKEVWEYYDKYK